MSNPFQNSAYAHRDDDRPPQPDMQAHAQPHYYDPYDNPAHYDNYAGTGGVNYNEAYYSQNGYGDYDYGHTTTINNAHPAPGATAYNNTYDDDLDDDDEMAMTKDAGAAGAVRGKGMPADKLNGEGGSSYYAHDRGLSSARIGGSIWAPSQKRQMQERSAVSKICRVLFCALFTAAFIIISIISLVVIFARPFNVGVGNVAEPSTSSVGLSGSALTFNGSVDFIISNPNSISSELTLDAKVYDTVDKSQDIGRGSVSKAKIEANANTTITFPYQVRYDPTKDTQKTIFKDLAEKCGLTGSGSSDLNLDLDVHASIVILSIAVPVSFSHAINIACPIPTSILKQVAGSLGSGSLGSLTGLVGRALVGWDALDDAHEEL